MQVACLARETDQALRLSGGAEGDSQMASEQGGGTERVAFNDIGFDGDCGSPKLVEDVSPAHVEHSVGDLERSQGESVGMLPGVERTVFVHAPMMVRTDHQTVNDRYDSRLATPEEPR